MTSATVEGFQQTLFHKDSRIPDQEKGLPCLSTVILLNMALASVTIVLIIIISLSIIGRETLKPRSNFIKEFLEETEK